MFISLRDLQLHDNKVVFDQEWQPETLDLGPDVRQSGSLKSNGEATLIEEHRGRKANIQDIRLAGDLATSLEISCARCLEPVTEPVTRSFDLLFRPQGVDSGVDEVSVPAAEADVGYYAGDGLLLEDILQEQVLLAVPIKTLCRENCKGLCPHCGQNLNLAGCDCAGPVDPRWTALHGLREKLGN